MRLFCVLHYYVSFNSPLIRTGFVLAGSYRFG